MIFNSSLSLSLLFSISFLFLFSLLIFPIFFFIYISSISVIFEFLSSRIYSFKNKSQSLYKLYKQRKFNLNNSFFPLIILSSVNSPLNSPKDKLHSSPSIILLESKLCSWPFKFSFIFWVSSFNHPVSFKKFIFNVCIWLKSIFFPCKIINSFEKYFNLILNFESKYNLIISLFFSLYNLNIQNSFKFKFSFCVRYILKLILILNFSGIDIILLYLNPFMVYKPYIASCFCNFSSDSNKSNNVWNIFKIYLFGKGLLLLYLYSFINKSEIDNKFKLNLRANNDEINLFGLNSVVFDSKDNIDFRYFGFDDNIFRMFILSNLDKIIFFKW